MADKIELTEWETTLSRSIRAYQPGLYVESLEESRAMLSIVRVAQHMAQARLGVRDITRWSCVSTVQMPLKNPNEATVSDEPQTMFEAVKTFLGKNEPDGKPSPGILILVDVKPVLDADPGLVRLLREAVAMIKAKSMRKTIIVLGDTFDVPAEIRADFSRIPFKIPSTEFLYDVFKKFVDSVQVSEQYAHIRPSKETLMAFARACTGLSESEARGLLSLAIAKFNNIDEDAVVMAQKEKGKAILDGNALTMLDSTVRMEQVGGMEQVKGWAERVRRILVQSEDAEQYGAGRPAGLLLVGVPGCLHGQTRVYDPVTGSNDRVADRCRRGEAFHVWAMGPQGPVVTAAMAPVCQGRRQMIRFTLKDGRKITVTPEHRFWNGAQWLHASSAYEQLRQSERVLLSTTSDTFLSGNAQDALRWKENTEGSPAGCLIDHRFGGAQLLQVAGTDQEETPSSGGAREHSRRCLRADDRASRAGYTRTCRLPVHLPTLGSSSQSSVRPKTEYHEAEREVSAVLPQRDSRLCQGGRQFVGVSSLSGTAGRTSSGVQGSKAGVASVESPVGDAVRYTFTPGSQELVEVVDAALLDAASYYDFHVPVYNNYWAAGLWHHNCGKSYICQALAHAWQLPLLRFEVGSAFGSLVGESEKNIRRMQEMAEALKPCVVMIDEIEKALGSDSNDGGTTARVKGSLLTWLQEKSTEIFVVATANDVTKFNQQPEMIRAGRFDAKFFVDLPDAKTRLDVFKIHLGKRGHEVDDEQLASVVKATKNYSPAEIEVICKDAINEAFCQDPRPKTVTPELLVQAARLNTPLYKTMEESIKKLRDWCKEGRARRAGLTTEDDLAAEPEPDTGDPSDILANLQSGSQK